MREIIPRPILLAMTLIVIVGAIVFVELQLDTPGTEEASAQANAGKQPEAAPKSAEKARVEAGDQGEKSEQSASERARGQKTLKAVSDDERIASKEDEYTKAREITGSTGLINTDGVSLKSAVGEKVVLVEFWTYSCYNCQNAQPHINALYEKYKDDGLLVVGVHSPEFGFEKDISNVREAVRQANIEYPVVLDNNYANWNAYDQRFWPAWYLIDADGFVRYKHFGEGAYDETDQKVQDLLAERDRISD
jgi:thiol-disulfide isomerase/thioredoxin